MSHASRLSLAIEGVHIVASARRTVRLLEALNNCYVLAILNGNGFFKFDWVPTVLSIVLEHFTNALVDLNIIDLYPEMSLKRLPSLVRTKSFEASDFNVLFWDEADSVL